MIYLDHSATSFPKPRRVIKAASWASENLGNPGRGGYPVAMDGANAMYRCRNCAARLFHCQPEQVVFTMNCTQGLNMAIKTLVKPGDKVVISGFEHNAVTRPLHGLMADVVVAGRRLFDWENTLTEFEEALKTQPQAAVFTHVSNVFGYVLPIEEMGKLCRQYGVPFIVDAAQSAGNLPIDLKKLGAEFIAMPGHKGLQGPMGTGLLLCGRLPEPLIEGGTGSQSYSQEMPDFLPDRGEAGTVNLPGICGLMEGMRWVEQTGLQKIAAHEKKCGQMAAAGLEELGVRVFRGPHQTGVVSFLPPDGDCEAAAEKLAQRGFCLRAGLHCAPTAHESAGTIETGTVRLSCGPCTGVQEIRSFLWAYRGVIFMGS